MKRKGDMKNTLPAHIQRLLATGERTGKNKAFSRNHGVFSVAMSACQHGWTCEEFISEILNPKNLVGEKYQDLNEMKARKKLEADWDRAIDFVEANPAVKGREAVEKRLDHVLDVVLRTKWSGRSGNTDRHVLLAMLALAYDVGTYTPAFSTRTLAMATNKGQETVRKSLSRLRESGHLKIITPSTYTKSPVYEITTLTLDNESLTTNPGRGLSDSITSVSECSSHDLFTRGGLGETAGRLWSSLGSEGSYTVRAMSELTGLSEPSCRTAVNRLVSVGLADSDEGRPARFTMAGPFEGDTLTLDMLLMELETWALPYGDDDHPKVLDYSGNLGKGEKRSERYKAEQQARRVQFVNVGKSNVAPFDPFTGEVLELPSRAA